LAALIGGMNIAIDTTAGERERGSLEPLLNNPLSRSALVLGKWLTTTFASTVISALAVLGFVLAGALLPLAELDVRILLGPVQAAQMLLVALPLAPFGAALQMLVACTARTFKEAQTYLGLLNLVPMAPAVVLMLYPNQGELWMAWVPALAQIAAITDILEGEPLGVWRILSLWGSSLLYTSVLLFALSRLLMRERIIFGR
jgi:sodium transport system permease protein